MTEQNINWQYAPTPPLPPKKKKGWRIRHIAAAYGIGGLILGSALAAAAVKPERVEVPGPERIVNHTEEKRVEVTPQSCLTALDLSGEGFGYAGQIIGYLNDAVQAAGRLNVTGLQEANANMEVVSPKFDALVPKAKAAEAECRAAGS